MAASTLVPTLHYFGFRGRALASRVALFNALGTDGWRDTRVSLPRFKKAPRHGAVGADRARAAPYVTDHLPQLDLPCGARVTQSHAIARYAARLAPSPAARAAPHFAPELYPADPRRGLLVDEAVAIVDQVLLLTPKDADPATRAARRRAYHEEGYLRVGMELLEGRLAASGGPFLLGGALSLADLYVRAPLGDLFDLQQFEGVPDTFYAEFPRVQACAAAVLEHPLLKAYHQHYKN